MATRPTRPLTAEEIAQLELLRREPLLNNPYFTCVSRLLPKHSVNADLLILAASDRRTGEQVAIKFHPRGYGPEVTEHRLRATINQMELSTARHPHLVEYREVFLTPHYLAVVCSLVAGITIEGFVEMNGGRLVENGGRIIFQQLLLALDFCHRQGKVVRDIKLSNVLLQINNGSLPILKLADFSVCKDLYRDPGPGALVGAALFVAPEVLLNSVEWHGDGRPADLWSVGVILFAMLFGRHPFLREEEKGLPPEARMAALLHRTLRAQVGHLPADPSVSPTCMDMLGRLLQPEPKNRITMEAALAHPWFMEGLPPGAASMNEPILARARQLNPREVASVTATLRRASVDDGGCDVHIPMSQPVVQTVGGTYQRPATTFTQSVASGVYTSQPQAPPAPRTASAAPAAPAAPAPAAAAAPPSATSTSSSGQPQQQRVGSGQSPVSQPQEVPLTRGPSQPLEDLDEEMVLEMLSPASFLLADDHHPPSIPLDDLLGSPEMAGPGPTSKLGPGRGAQQPRSSVDFLRQAALNTPSSTAAAFAPSSSRLTGVPEGGVGGTTGDGGMGGVRGGRGGGGVVDRTRVLPGALSSFAFMKEFNSASIMDLLGSSPPSGELLGGVDDAHHDVDVARFLVEDPIDQELPMCAIDALDTSFNWGAFNDLFTPPTSSEIQALRAGQVHDHHGLGGADAGHSMDGGGEPAPTSRDVAAMRVVRGRASGAGQPEPEH